MAFLKADRKYVANGVTVNEYLLTKHNPNGIDMPWAELKDIIGYHSQHRLDIYSKRHTPV